MNKTTVPFVKNGASNSSIASHMIKPEINLVIFIVSTFKDNLFIKKTVGYI